MAEFISNQRKTLRFQLRCPALVTANGTQIDGQTEDIGAYGCRMVIGNRLEPRTSLWLFVEGPERAPPLRVQAVVVWTGSGPAYHHGLAFERADRPIAQRWCDGLAEQHPDLLFDDRVPDRLELAARVFVAPVPPELTLLAEEEAALVRLACHGATVADLRERLGADWSSTRRALFALLSRGILTLDAAEAGDPSGWRTLLGGVEHRAVARRN